MNATCVRRARLLFLVFCCASLVPFGAFCAGKQEAAATAGAAESVTYAVLDYGVNKISNDLHVFKYVSERTGITITPVPLLRDEAEDVDPLGG